MANNINNSYGKSISVAIANTTLDNVLNAHGLPTNSIIVNTEYDYENNVDLGHPSMTFTNFEGNAYILSRYIEEKNGLYADAENPNSIYLHIDNETLVENNNGLSINVENLVDGNTLKVSNKEININVNNLNKSSKNSFGVVKVDDSTIKSDNGIIYVATDKLDLANGNLAGIAKGDNNTIIVNNGILSVNTTNLNKASSTSYGIVKPDNTTIVSNNGILSVNTTNLNNSNQNNLEFNSVDNDTIVSNNGIISVNQQNIPKATSSTFGTVKLDSQSLETNLENVVSIKNYSSFSYIYTLEEGITNVEERISYLRDIIDNGGYINNTPRISHVSCNETTTSVLAKPQPMEEPINMELQHVYVSLNVITNCNFTVDVLYENNETPTIELDNINYNDEYHLQGLEALNHTWESTEMKEKNIILLFNCKNFYSSTGPKTKITKINISITAKENNKETKKIVYSIIRYNSYFIEDEEPENPDIEYTTEYIIDEEQSMWICIDSSYDGNYRELDIENPDPCIKQYAYLNDIDEISTISGELTNKIKSEDYILILRGYYKNVKTNIISCFNEVIEAKYFQTSDEENMKYVIDYPKKIDFDILYYKLKYQAYNPHIFELIKDEDNINKVSKLTFEMINEKSFEETFSCYIEYDNGHVITTNNNYIDNHLFLVINSNKIIKPENPTETSSDIIYDFDKNNNDTPVLLFGSQTGDTEYCLSVKIFKANGITDISCQKIEITSKLLKQKIKRADLYFVNPSADPINIQNLEKYYQTNQAAKISFITIEGKYSIDAYLHIGETKDFYEYLYQNGNTTNYNISLSYNIKYNERKDNDCVLTYTYSYYPVNNTNNVYKYSVLDLETTGNGDTVFNNISIDEPYCYTVNYNFYLGNDETLEKREKTTSFVLSPYSKPIIDITGISNVYKNNNEKYVIDINNANYDLKQVKSINGETNVNNLFNYITISYTYNSSKTLDDISFSEIGLSNCKINISDYQGKSIKTIGIDVESNKINSTAYDSEPLSSSSYTVDIDHQMFLSYVHETGNENYHSNIIGHILHKNIIPSFIVSNISPLYYDGTTIYSYCCIDYSSQKNKIQNIIVKDNNNKYLSNHSYYEYKHNGDISIDTKYLYDNAFSSITYSPTQLDAPKLQLSYNESSTYIAYNNETNFVFSLGTLTNGSLNNKVKLYTTLSYVLDNKNYNINLLNDLDENNIIGSFTNTIDLTDATNIFISAYASYIDSNIVAYYNPIIYSLSYANNEFVVNNDNTANFCEDALYTFAYSLNNKHSINVHNNANLKLEIFNSRSQLAYTVIGDAYDILQVNNENIDNSGAFCFNALLKTIVTQSSLSGRSSSGYDKLNNNQLTEIPIAYIYNIPNIIDGFEQYCVCDNYGNYVIPRFTKKYDKYFTPYDFSVEAFESTDLNTNILNKKVDLIKFDTNDKQIPIKQTKIIFKINYKGRLVLEKTISTIRDNNFDSVAYLFKDDNIKTIKTTSSNEKTNTNAQQICYSYCYYSYSSTNKYLYSPLSYYMDVEHYSNILFENFSNNSKQHGIRNISLNSSGSIILENNNETIDENNIHLYLTYYDNDELKYLWKYSDVDDTTNTTIYTFDLCQYGNSKLVINPPLKSDYSLQQIKTL